MSLHDVGNPIPADKDTREHQKFGKDGSVMINGSELTFKGAYDGSNNLIYAGLAPIGSSAASAVWQIRKLTYTGSNLTDVQWASGTAKFDKIWNSRTGYTYS